MTLNEMIAMAKKNGIDFDSEIDWDFDAEEDTELSCIANGDTLELSFIKQGKNPDAWLKENFSKVAEVLKTFKLEINRCDSYELGIKVPTTFESDFAETVIDSLNEITPEGFFFEENYLDEEDSIWFILLSVA